MKLENRKRIINVLEKTLKKDLSYLLEKPDAIYELHMDSLQYLQLSVAIEKEFGIELPIELSHDFDIGQYIADLWQIIEGDKIS